MMQACDRELSQHIPKLGVHIEIDYDDCAYDNTDSSGRLSYLGKQWLMRYINAFFKFPDRIKIGVVTWHDS